MTFSERRQMWREKRQMHRFHRLRIALAVLVLVLSVVEWVTESSDLLLVTTAIMFFVTVPFLVSDFRVDAQWRKSKAGS